MRGPRKRPGVQPLTGPVSARPSRYAARISGRASSSAPAAGHRDAARSPARSRDAPAAAPGTRSAPPAARSARSRGSAARIAPKICRTTSGARPRLGSSSSSRRGWLISARPIASICCSPPDSVPPRWPMRSFRRGNRVNTCSRDCVVLAQCRRPGRPSAGSRAPSCGEDAAAFRRLRHAAPHDLVRRQPRDVVPVVARSGPGAPAGCRRSSSSAWTCRPRWRRSASRSPRAPRQVTPRSAWIAP